MAAAMGAAAKRMVSMPRARAAASAAAAAARTAPRWIHSTGGEVGGDGAAAAAAKAGRTVTRRLHSSRDKKDLETALSDHKLDTKQLLHEQNMKIKRLQNDFDITKLELEITKFDLKNEVIKGKTTFLYYAAAVLGVAMFAPLLSDLASLS